MFSVCSLGLGCEGGYSMASDPFPDEGEGIRYPNSCFQVISRWRRERRGGEVEGVPQLLVPGPFMRGRREGYSSQVLRQGEEVLLCECKRHTSRIAQPSWFCAVGGGYPLSCLGGGGLHCPGFRRGVLTCPGLGVPPVVYGVSLCPRSLYHSPPGRTSDRTGVPPLERTWDQRPEQGPGTRDHGVLLPPSPNGQTHTCPMLR